MGSARGYRRPGRLKKFYYFSLLDRQLFILVDYELELPEIDKQRAERN